MVGKPTTKHPTILPNLLLKALTVYIFIFKIHNNLLTSHYMHFSCLAPNLKAPFQDLY